MTSNRFFGERLASVAGLGLLVGFSVAAVQGCDDGGSPLGGAEEICGPCGSIVTGQLSISGNAQLDGFFTAVADLGKATATIQGDFEANVLALGRLYGVADAAIDASYIASLKAAIKADFDANIEGSIRLVYKPPRCEADISVSVEAQAQCEVQAECNVMADPGMVAVSCEGKCEGSCSGECMGDIVCRTPTAGISCSGECEGSCELTTAASCEGTCHGQCDTECSARNEMGECHGTCSGMCMGSCELSARAECGGTCHGTCYASADPGGCEGSVDCSGSCMGECSGSCQGDYEPPSASADCEASADCKAQAKAQAQANVTCTPPSLDWEFGFRAGVEGAAQAAFTARLGELRARGIAIVQGLARARALIDGTVDGEVVFDPAPVANLTAQVQGLISAGVSGDLDIAVGRLPCVIPAFQDAGNILADVTTEFSASLALQADLGASILNPQAG